MPFIHEDFLLHTETARRLYHSVASKEPILDFHSHLPPGDIAANRQFANLFEIWLEGDHYKWRAMRSNGVPERYCTGDAPAKEKFLAWAKTSPQTLRNPLFHWTQLELKRYFGIDDILSPETAESIWERANSALQHQELSAKGILRHFEVDVSCTVDDPADDLSAHRCIAASKTILHRTQVLPTFRPDRAVAVDRPSLLIPWLERLGEASQTEVRTFPDLLSALKRRHDAFHEIGCRLSDHGIERFGDQTCTEKAASQIFARALAGTPASREEREMFTNFLMLFLARLDFEKGWTKLIHFGAMRNNNTRLNRLVGPDTGFDSIGDWPQCASLAAYLDQLDGENSLPKIILFNANPADNYALGSLIGCYQDGKIAGKVQFGPGWWFLDQKEGMEWQLNTLSNLGLLSRFVGMVTDSRSFMSFPRHEYFRRVLCNLLGRDVEHGEIPNDDSLLVPLVRDLCYGNAQAFLGFDSN